MNTAFYIQGVTKIEVFEASKMVGNDGKPYFTHRVTVRTESGNADIVLVSDRENLFNNEE